MKRVFVAAIIAILCFGLTACSSPSPTEVTNDFLEGIKTKDSEAVNAHYAGEDIDLLKDVKESEADEDEVDKVLETQLKDKLFKFEYTVSNEKIDGDKATVDVSVKTYDFGKAFTAFMQEYMEKAFSMALNGSSEDAIEKVAAETLSKEIKKAAFDYEQTITLGLSKKDGEWMVDPLDEDSDFYNALTGGMLKAAKNIEEAFGE